MPVSNGDPKEPGRSNAIDMVVRQLAKRVPWAFCRLAGVADDRAISLVDTAVHVPTFTADQVMVVGEEGDPDRFAIHWEFQLEPDERVLMGWVHKNAALNVQLGVPVLLVAVYLHRGDRASFPDRLTNRTGKLVNEFTFTTLRLWEHVPASAVGSWRPLPPCCFSARINPGLRRSLRSES